VLTGDADSARTGRTQDIHIQVVPLLSGRHRASGGHHGQASTPALGKIAWGGQAVCVFQALENQAGTGFTVGTWSTNARDCSRVCSLR
jgi:hypothetical protein